MIIQIALGVLLAIQLLALVVTPSQVGKHRNPITGPQATGYAVMHILLIGLIITALMYGDH